MVLKAINPFHLEILGKFSFLNNSEQLQLKIYMVKLIIVTIASVRFGGIKDIYTVGQLSPPSSPELFIFPK